MTQTTCKLCLQDSDKINNIGQCQKCANQCRKAQQLTIKGRGVGLEKWHKIMKKRGGEVFSN